MNIFDIFLGTPYWVWGIFAYLVYVGIKATKPHAVPVLRMGIIPTIFILWSLYSAFYKCNACPHYVGLWFLALLMGIYIGYRIALQYKINRDANNCIHVPGSFLPLLLSMLFFTLKYMLGVSYALYPILKANMLLLSVDLTVSGLISGIFLGRFGYILFQCFIQKKFDL